VIIIEIYNKYDKTFQDYNEIMKIEDEMKFATVNLNIAEVNNLILLSWIHSEIFLAFLLIPISNYDNLLMTITR